LCYNLKDYYPVVVSNFESPWFILPKEIDQLLQRMIKTITAIKKCLDKCLFNNTPKLLLTVLWISKAKEEKI
jgi:hypothetical protein